MPFGYTHSWLREDDEFDRYNKPGSPDWFDLSDDVSFDKPNNRHDALKVESLLGYGGYLDLDKGGGAMGLGPRRLEEPLKAFQEKNGLKVDGLLKPGGPTIAKMKQLYERAFAGSPAPTPAMMDVQAELIDEGKDGFIHGAAPKPLPRPNKRLDAKTELFDYERWNDDWARNATDPASFAPEYESYIRQIEPTHGHDPGLIYARDFAQKVEKRRGKGGAFVQSLLARLADRPDLQRAFLGGEVPHHPPQGTFRPGGETGVKDWIDQDRIANGIAPKYSKAAQAVQSSAPALRTSSGVAPASETPQTPEPDYRNLLEYVNNFGFPGSEPPEEIQAVASESGADKRPTTYDDLSDTAKAIASGMGRSRGEPGVQVAMAGPGQFPFEPIREVDVTQFDGAWSKLPTSPLAQPGAATAKPPPARGPSAGEGGLDRYDPNQMMPATRPPAQDRAPAPPKPAPLRFPTIVDPSTLNDDDFERAWGQASEGGAQAGAEAAAAQAEVDRLKTALRELPGTFWQRISIGVAEGMGTIAETLPPDAPDGRGPDGKAASRALQRYAGDAAFQGGSEALGSYLNEKWTMERQLADAESLAKRGSEVAEAYRSWSRTLANDRLRRSPPENDQ